MKNFKIVLTALILFLVQLSSAQIPSVELDFKNASVTTQNDEIIISTGKMTGKWKWTGKGFVTTGFRNLQTGKEWVNQQPEHLADWDLGIFKDQWLFAPYLNLNQIMFNVQTTEHVDPEYSNARLYGDVYSFAIAMMSTPLFFTETHRYSPEDREAVKEIISICKKYREDLYQGYVFSLGERPDDTAWAGFQNVHPGKDFGYMTLYREIDNKKSTKNIQLKFLQDKKLMVEDLVTGKKKTLTVDKDGFTTYEIKEPASFKFYKYTIL